MNRILIVAALVAAPSLAPALARSPASADRVQVVRHADLDLTKDADVRKLDRRIRFAVKGVCGPTSDANPKGKNEARRCRIATSEGLSTARASAIASASRPAPTILASQR